MFLKQGGRDLAQYDQQFNRLMRFGLGLVSTEKDRIKKFLNGMKLTLQKDLSPFEFETYGDLLDKAMKIERAHKQLEEYRSRDNKKRSFQNNNGQNK